ncbi:MAG: hypothetical protein J6R49_03660 [Clostridia bacterium]|nr:hypothetical protein [Clostridia bacterium]
MLPNDDALIAGIFSDVKGRIEEETERRKNERELKNEEPRYTEAEEESPAEEAAVAAAEGQPELSPEAKEAEDEYLKYMMGENEEEESTEE